MEVITKVKRSLQLWREGIEKFDEADRELSSGPARYYYEKIECYVDALFNKYAPFKENDRVEIIKTPNTDNNWSHCKHFLIIGATGTVQDVDYRDDSFCAHVVFDNETWIDREGNEQPIRDKHGFLMFEDQIKRISKEACPQCGHIIKDKAPENKG